MISFTVKDKAKLAKNIFGRNQKFISEVRKNFIIAGDEFIELIRGRWYKQRNPDDTGLNRISHNLHNKWLAEVRERGFDIVAVISCGMNYGKYHEFGTDKLPQRSFVRHDLKLGKGKDFFIQAVKDALKEF